MKGRISIETIGAGRSWAYVLAVLETGEAGDNPIAVGAGATEAAARSDLYKQLRLFGEGMLASYETRAAVLREALEHLE